MKKIYLVITLFLATILLSTHLFASAVVVGIKGKVDVIMPDGKSLPAKIGLELPNGTQVKVTDGGEVSIMLETGALDQIFSGSVYKVGAEASNIKRTELGKGLSVAMQELRGEGNGPTIHSMVENAKTPPQKLPAFANMQLLGIAAIYPTKTTIRPKSRIVFSWSDKPKINWPNPVIVVNDANKKHLFVGPISPDKNSVTVDIAKAKIKKGGLYTWYLASNEKEIKGKSLRFEFKTASVEEEKTIDSALAKINNLPIETDGKDLLIAQLYFGHGLYDEAVQKLLPLWQKTKAPFVKKLIVISYSKMGREEEANN